jgi:23S rRNA (guanosine2251-2'-O)-methyltransferase
VNPVLTLAQRCPYPDCGAPFAAAPGDHGHQIPCPTCGRKLVVMDQATVRRREMERLKLETAAAGTASADRPSAARSDREAAGIDQEERRDPELIALLENVRSLWNVGSMFRTADGAGFGRLVLTGITAAPPRPEIAKTALGADAIVPWEYEADPEAAARRLLDSGFRLLALETSPRSRPLAEIDCRGPLCLVVGHEVAGISGRLLALAADVAFLPMRGRKSSLNVAVAFGIAAYHLATAREQSVIGPRPAPAI